MCSAALNAQEHNVVMTIDGEPIARSIFIDAYKQNYPNGVSSKKELYHFAEGYAEYYLIRKVAAQQEQGITIDVEYRYFSTAKRKFIIAVTP